MNGQSLGDILGAGLKARDASNTSAQGRGYAWHPYYELTFTVQVSHSELANTCEALLTIGNRDRVYKPNLQVVVPWHKWNR